MISNVGVGANRLAHPRRQVMAGQTLGRARAGSCGLKAQFAQTQTHLRVSMNVVEIKRELMTKRASMGCAIPTGQTECATKKDKMLHPMTTAPSPTSSLFTQFTSGPK